MKNLAKIMGRILLIAIVLCIYEGGVRFLYQDYQDTAIYTNRDRAKLEGSIETLVLGNSTAQRGFETAILDEELDTVSFNLATSLQPLAGSYALLKDANKKNPIKRLFLGVTPQMMEREDVSTISKSLVYERLYGAESKASYLKDGCKLEEIPYLFLYSARVGSYGKISYVKTNVSMKLSSNFQQGETCKKNYKGNGRIAWKKTFDPETERNTKVTKESFVAEQSQETSLRKIMEYCNDKDIQLILTWIPQTEEALAKYEDVSEINQYFKNLSQEYQVCFWDFNCYKNAEELFTNQMFQDKKHLNKTGGDVFTKEFAMTYNRLQEGEYVGALFTDDSSYLAEQGGE